MTLGTLSIIAAFIIFCMGAWSRWWASPQPYYPAFVCAGLALLTFGVYIYPLLGK